MLAARVAQRSGVAPDERRGERGALPEVVVVGLGHARPEAPAQLRLQPGQLLALALQASVGGEMQVNLDDGEVRHRYVSVCSTCFVS